MGAVVAPGSGSWISAVGGDEVGGGSACDGPVYSPTSWRIFSAVTLPS